MYFLDLKNLQYSSIEVPPRSTNRYDSNTKNIH